MQEPLRIKLNSSKLTLCYLWLLHLSALFGVVLLPLPTLVLLGLIVLLLASLFFYRYRYSHPDWPYQVRSLVIKGESCRVVLCNRESYHASLANRHFVCNYLVVLKLNDRGRRLPRYLPVWRGALDDGLFRQLKVRLRFREGYSADS